VCLPENVLNHDKVVRNAKEDKKYFLAMTWKGVFSKEKIELVFK